MHHADQAPKTVSVLLCTYRRPSDLLRCLAALELQTRRPDSVDIIVRETDIETQAAIDQYGTATLLVRPIQVTRPGLVAAHNVGLRACTSDLLAMIDDDTVPRPDWLERVFTNFVQDPSLGGLGGRDRTFYQGAFDDRQIKVFAKLQWFGRAIGNQHVACGPLREVDFLKGANMSYRMLAVGKTVFDERLRGGGSQANEDLAFSLAVRRKGWKTAFDPQAIVEHFPGDVGASRPYGGVSRVTDATALRDLAYNEVIAVWDTLTIPRRFAFVLWSVLVGTGICPGLVQAFRYTTRLGVASWRRMVLAQQGKFAALRDLRKGSAD